MTTKEIKLLLDYNNYIKECVSNNTDINKDTIREFANGSHFYKRHETISNVIENEKM